MRGARFGGAAAEDAAERGADMLGARHHRDPPIARVTKIHSTTVIAIDPTRLAARQPLALLRPKAAAGIPDQVADAAEHVVDHAQV